ncbi:hypothetical protein WA026_022873 [Henosepilachna vigintioctopunctata]|uniref:Uncharacterized protein n=1 Tax=Henosepilachna vigintioctopunctata TaxID=420089 RepID=A0AAW1UEP1_9CUCU
MPYWWAWRGAVMMAKYRAMLLSAQRTILLRVLSGYRTVSIEAAQIIAETPHLDLLVGESGMHNVGKETLTGVRRMARKMVWKNWQRRWSQATGTAECTKRIIAQIQP